MICNVRSDELSFAACPVRPGNESFRSVVTSKLMRLI